MNKIRLLLSMFLWLGFNCSIYSQQLNQTIKNIKPLPCKQNSCSHKQDKGLQQVLEESLGSVAMPIIKSTEVDADFNYVIPIVFHVFGTEFNNKTTVTKEIIEDALRRTNEDFNGLTKDYNSINPGFDAIKDKLNITFKLAEKDPDGNMSSGVTFHDYASGFGVGGSNDALIQQYAWDNYKYMNVYIQWDLYADKEYANSGVAWYPETAMSDANVARVVYNGSYLGNNTDENFRSVLTHEFGHFFNLIHTFDGGCTYPNDKVDDTPPVKESMWDPNTVNCEGNLTNTQNFMNYSNNYAMFTKGQVARMKAALQHPTRSCLWKQSNLDEVFFNTPTPRIQLANSTIKEALVNDGSFTDAFTFKITDAEYSGKDFVIGTDYTITGLPDGLSSSLLVENGELKLKLIGNSENNLSKDNFEFSISLKNSIIKDGDIFEKNFKFKVEYRNAYEIVISDQLTNLLDKDNAWTWVGMQFGNAEFGLFYLKDKYKFQSYSKRMIAFDGTNNIKPLVYGDEISPASKWTTPEDEYEGVFNIATNDFDSWNGKTAYAAVEFQNEGLNHYGWVKFSVAEDGKSYKMLQYAYSTEPLGAIIAGQVDINASSQLYYSASSLKESTKNDGTFDQVLNIDVLGDKIILDNGLLDNSKFTITGLPEGITSKVEVVNKNLLTINLEGVAVNNELVNNTSLDISFDKSIFEKATSEVLINTDKTIELVFRNSYTVIYNDIEDVLCDESNPWTQVNFDQLVPIGKSNFWFGTWYDTDGNLRLEAKKRDIVCFDGTSNIKPLPEGTLIEWDSDQWNQAGEYPDEHVIYNKDYTDWAGKNAYIGMVVYLGDGPQYGWIHIDVAKDAKSYKMLDFAYWDGPDKFIRAGQKTEVFDDAFIIAAKPEMYEQYDNFGTVADSLKIDLINSEFKIVNANLETSNYTISNIPDGLTASIFVVDKNTARLTFDGKAINHEEENNSACVISFKESSFVDASKFKTLDANFSIEFINEYKIVYEDISDIVINADKTWEKFFLSGNGYGAWLDSGKLRIESYEKAIVCEGTSRNISVLPEGMLLNEDSNFIDGGDYPNEHDLYSTDYTKWGGKEGYIGLKLIYYDQFRYGWAHIKVNEDGTEFTVLDIAYNEDYRAGILTGQKAGFIDSDYILFDGTSFGENIANDGSFSESKSIALQSTSFSQEDGILDASKFSVEGLDNGLSLRINIENDKKAILTLIGKSENNEESDNYKFKLIFKDDAFVNASDVSNKVINFDLSFLNEYKIVYKQIANVEVNSATTWKMFDINDYWFGAWYEKGKLRLETYRLPIVCEGNTKHVSVIGENVLIDANSNFVEGGEYPDEHDIFSTEYSKWKGQDAYIAMQIPYFDKVRYAWIHVVVNADGNGFKITELAYNEDYNLGIKTGQKENFSKNLKADFTTDSFVVDVNSTIDITNTSIAAYNIKSYTWSVDGKEYTDKNISDLEFNTVGDFTISLKLEDSKGNVDITKKILRVVNPIDTKSLFSASEINIKEGSSILFTNESSSSLDIVSYKWYFVGGTPDTFDKEIPSEVLFNTPGEFTIYLDIEDAEGNKREFTKKINVSERGALNAGFTCLNSTIKIGESISFVNKTENDNPILSYLWTFEGGEPATSTDVNATVNYSQAGNYTVKLEVKNEDGVNVNEQIDYVRVIAPLKPFAAFNVSKNEIIKGQNVVFTDNTLYAADEIKWTFEGGTPASSTDKEVSVTYANEGEYSVKLYAKNSFGENIFIKEKAIIVKSSSYCDAYYDGTYTGISKVQFGDINNASEKATYSDFSQKSTNVKKGETYKLKIHHEYTDSVLGIYIDWNNDGDFDDEGELLSDTKKKEKSLDVTYEITIPLDAISGTTRMRINSGTWRAKRTCGSVGSDGEVEDYSIYIEENLPKANFSANKTQIVKGETIKLTNLSENNPTDYLWSLEGADNISSTQENPIATYMQAGEFEITLKAINGTNEDIKTIKLIVTENEEVVMPSFVASENKLLAGDYVSFKNTSMFNPDYTYLWTLEGATPSSSTDESPSVVYTKQGVYDVSLQITSKGESKTTIKKGLISVTGFNKPVALLEANIITALEGNDIEFADLSNNDPTQWKWTFEGATPSTSTEQNPVVNYAKAGSYSVSLTAINEFGESTTTHENYISIDALDANAYTIPKVNISEENPNWLAIYEVKYGNVNNKTQDDGYSDFTNLSTDIELASSFELYVKYGDNNWESNHVFVWVDWNHNNKFEESELMDSKAIDKATLSNTLTITVPADAKKSYTRMRIRTAYDATRLPSMDETNAGEIEDYTVNIIDPIAETIDFVASNVDVEKGSNAFFSITKGDYDSIKWTFEGANTTESTIANPNVTYDEIGEYAVSLALTKNANTIVESKTAYINVIEKSDIPSIPTDIILVNLDIATMSNGVLFISEDNTGDVCSLVAVDEDSDNKFTFSLIENEGDYFSIEGDKLNLVKAFDYEAELNHSIKIEVRNKLGASFEKEFTIKVDNVNDTPTNVTLTNSDNSLIEIAENTKIGTVISTISADDADNDKLSFVLNDESVFSIRGNDIVLKSKLDYETLKSYSLILLVGDGNGASINEQITVNVSDVDDAPNTIVLSNNSIDENMPVDTVIGALSASDEDTDSSEFVFSVDNNVFKIEGSNLVLNKKLDFNNQSEYNIIISVSDGNSKINQEFNISVNDVNLAPTDIILDNIVVSDTYSLNQTIASISAVDYDLNEEFTFSVIDSKMFKAEGKELVLISNINRNEYDFSILVKDKNNNEFTKEFTLLTLYNNAPIAKAGISQTVNEGEAVILDGSKSSDVDANTTLTYVWKSVSSDIVLTDATTATPSFTAPTVDKDTDYTLVLVVSDGKVASDLSEVIISVTNVNNAPIADAGIAQTVNERAIVKLDGSKSSDVDANTNLTYAWTIDDSSISIDDATTATPSFRAPAVDKDTDYTFSLIVNDGELSSSVSKVTITVSSVNHAPVSNAGIAQHAKEGETVVLDGSRSIDVDFNTILTYKWTCENPSIVITNALTDTPSFTVPNVEEDTNYVFELTVSDGELSSSSTVVVGIKNVTLSAQFTISKTTLFVGESIRILNISKNEGCHVQYFWTFEGSSNCNSKEEHPEDVFYNKAGTYSITLEVTDNHGNRTPSSKRIEVIKKVKKAISINDFSKSILQGEKIKLSTESNFKIAEYNWYIEGSNTNFSNSNSPEFYYSKAGIYSIKLVAKDKDGEAITVNVTDIIVNAYQPEADFDCSSKELHVGDAVDFTDTSVFEASAKIVKYEWAFEGGNPSVFEGKTPPAINYDKAGEYACSLTITDEYGNISILKHDAYIIVDQVSAVVDIHVLKCSIYPNPTADYIYIENANNADVYIHSLNGALIMKLKANSNKYMIDLTSLTSGTYLIKAKSGKAYYINKIVIQ